MHLIMMIMMIGMGVGCGISDTRLSDISGAKVFLGGAVERRQVKQGWTRRKIGHGKTSSTLSSLPRTRCIVITEHE